MLFTKRSFTLVEMSVVIVIISIALATVIVSKILITSAKINKIMEDARNLDTLTNVFLNTFGCLPGDCNMNELPSYIVSNTPSGCFNLESDYVTHYPTPIITTGFDTGIIDLDAKRTCGLYEMQALEPQAFGVPITAKLANNNGINSIIGINKAYAIGTTGKLYISGNPIITSLISSQTASLQSQINANNATIAANNSTITSNTATINGNNSSINSLSASVMNLATGTFSASNWQYSVTSSMSNTAYPVCYPNNTYQALCVNNVGQTYDTYVNGQYIYVYCYNNLSVNNGCGMSVGSITSGYNPGGTPSSPYGFVYSAVQGSCGSGSYDICYAASSIPTAGGSLGAVSSAITSLKASNTTLTANNNTLTANNTSLTAQNTSLQTQINNISDPNNFLAQSIATATEPTVPGFPYSAIWDMRTVNGSSSETPFYPYEAAYVPTFNNKTAFMIRSSLNNISLTDTSSGNAMSAISPTFALKMDVKYDDGLPYSGRIIGGKNYYQMNSNTSCNNASGTTWASVISTPSATQYINSNSIPNGCIVGITLGNE